MRGNSFSIAWMHVLNLLLLRIHGQWHVLAYLNQMHRFRRIISVVSIAKLLITGCETYHH